MTWLVIAMCCATTTYAVVAAFAMPFFGKRSRNRNVGWASVSVLKPLCGTEPRLYENLETFCNQAHPCFQLLFGVSSPVDPAIGVVRRLQAAYPQCDIELVIDSRVHGSNLKVSNLINMAERARHDIIVLADSDIAVEPDYLDTVIAPLADPDTGVVTCLYRAQSVGGFWPRLGAMFINEWFAPSVRVAHAGGSRRFGFGATLALRRETLAGIGGFETLKDCLADDYWLAEHARTLGLNTVLSPVMVATDVIEPTFTTLWLRELRWLRTIRSVNPPGFASLVVTFTAPWLVIGALMLLGIENGEGGTVHAWMSGILWISTITGSFARILLHVRSARYSRSFWHDLPLVPLRDTLLALQWLAAVFGSHVVWRGARMAVVNRVTQPRTSIVEMSDRG
ncbi:glycosyltransferase [Paraburkholderia sp. DHOC27]|nr:glycosyltransferase [Paraburkholderia sp. DHOC27]